LQKAKRLFTVSTHVVTLNTLVKENISKKIAKVITLITILWYNNIMIELTDLLGIKGVTNTQYLKQIS